MDNDNLQSVLNVSTQAGCKQSSVMYISIDEELLKDIFCTRYAYHPAHLAVISLLYLKTDSRRQLNNSLINTILFCAFYKTLSASKELHQTCLLNF